MDDNNSVQPREGPTQRTLRRSALTVSNKREISRNDNDNFSVCPWEWQSQKYFSAGIFHLTQFIHERLRQKCSSAGIFRLIRSLTIVQVRPVFV